MVPVAPINPTCQTLEAKTKINKSYKIIGKRERGKGKEGKKEGPLPFCFFENLFHVQSQVPPGEPQTTHTISEGPTAHVLLLQPDLSFSLGCVA